LIIKQGIVVQSIKFRQYLPVGVPTIAVEYLNRWGIDEIVLLDIDATPQKRRPRYEKVVEYSKYCQVPLGVGGGITEISDIENLIRSGADKVVINTGALENPDLINQGARLFGNQSIVVAIDVRQCNQERYEVFTHSGTRPTGTDPFEWAKIAEDRGAGEIFLNSIDRDGSKKGYDLELIENMVAAVSIPVIVCGGVNHPRHFLEAMNFNVSALAAANFYHYSEHSAIATKSFLKQAGLDSRLDTYAMYDGCNFDEAGRVAKIEDGVLEKLRFESIPEEVI
jgi:cyclase